jgi:hypothetical protein
MKKSRVNSDLSGSRILILSGNFEGREGICLGTGTEPSAWAISPENSNAILDLKFEKEFALLVDLSGKRENN